MAVTINASTSTGLVQSADTSGEIELQSNGTTALKVNTNEGIQILNCLGVGNATPSTSGAGITFPATQSASTDANTLDDYEEGTFTPTLGCTTTNPTVTYTNRIGRYTKVGKFVFAIVRISLSAASGGSGQVQIQGLPFTAVSGAISGGMFVNYMDGWITNGPTGGYTQGGNTTAILHYFNGGTGPGNLFAANIGSITDVSLSFVYEVA